MTYPEAIQFLYSLRTFGTKLGLANTFKLATLAGNPQNQLRFIHVAGTNGKGSTCAMLESIYRQAGLRVGLFTSPHLVAFGERIQVNRRNISEGDVTRLVAMLQTLLTQFPRDEHPTFFEVVTVMALIYFAEQKCDLVIWETGLGGRLDSTNIVTPLAAVITNIHYDHEQWLGSTLASIAAEKAGIIKPGVPVITAADEPEALRVIMEIADAQKARLTRVLAPRSGAENAPDAEELKTSLVGRHQKTNAALAVATVRALSRQIAVSEDAIRSGLSEVNWPGRLQLVTGPAGQKILLDGAHNVAGAQSLREALDEYFPDQRPTLILGVLSDKNWQAICDLLAPRAARILLVPVSSERTASPVELVAACRKANPSTEIAAFPSLAEALNKALDQDFIVITGSLYLVGEALEYVGTSANAKSGERALNEWSGTPSIPSQKV
jgi:dihydrofolate synthase/folylpolyglutamate synthase